MIRLVLLTLLLAPSLSFANGDLIRSIIRMPVAGAYKYSGRCGSIFGDSFSIVTTPQGRGGLTSNIIDYYYSPEIRPWGAQRISRFYKVRGLEVYTGQWYRHKLESEENYQNFPDHQNAPTKELVRHWEDSFAKDPNKVEELIDQSGQADPLRRIHVGYRAGKEHWSGVDIFDGSTPLRIFDHNGKLVETNLASNNRSELEIRFPELILPERVQQDNGIDTPLFFISRRTTLPMVNRVYSQQAHHIALLLLMKLNPEFTTNQITKYKSEELDIEFNIHSMNRMARPLERLPRYQKTAPVTASFDGYSISAALHNATGVYIYTSADPRMLKSLNRRGWKIFENETTQNLPDDMTIIRMEVTEFIGRHLIWNSSDAKTPVVTQKGRESRAYLELERIEEQRLEAFRKYWYSFRENRRRFYSEQFE